MLLLELLEGSRKWRTKSNSPEAWIAQELQCWLQMEPWAGAGPLQVSPRLVTISSCCLCGSGC